MIGNRYYEEVQGKFISAQGLRNLAEYEYSGEDKSIIYNFVVNPFAKWLCGLLPKFIAPNILTLLGLLCNCGAYVLVAVWIPTFTEFAPRWVYFVAAILILCYLVLDAMDGNQARITDMASPMGEIFDHLMDSLSVSLCVLIFGATFRLGITWSFVVLLSCWIPFYLSHWDDYNTGKLIMGRFGGPTDLLFLLIVVLVLTGSIGPEMWLYSLGSDKYNFHLHAVTIVFIIAGSAISIIQYTTHVYRHRADLDSPRSHGIGVVAQLAPFAFLFITCVLWGSVAPYLLQTYPHQFFIMIGLVNAYVLARIIVQRVTSEPTISFYGILAILFLAFFVSFVSSSPILPWHQNRIAAPLNFVLLHGVLILAFAQWAYFFVSVVRQLSVYLNIPVLTVPKEKQNTSRDEKSHLLSREERHMAENGEYQTSLAAPSPLIEKSGVDSSVNSSGAAVK